MPTIKWTCLPFDELTTTELYTLLQLRSEVFVVEQQCIYQDMDGEDKQALHLWGTVGESLVCYARLFAPGVKYATASIGRVLTSPDMRGHGLGKSLMLEAVANCDELWPADGITISAQQHLEKFYNSIGFTAASEPYMEDGIPHIQMYRG